MAITITGANFGASQGTSTVTFNGLAAGTATNWSSTNITVAVPQAASSGNIVVTVGGVASNGASFVVLPGISFLSPNSGPVGTTVFISGSNFGASQGSSTVTFNGINAGAASSWSNSNLTVTVPVGATTGNIVVTVNAVASPGKLFGVPANPSSVSPTSGAAGVQVTLSGSGFGPAQGTGFVWLGSARGTVVSWSNTQVVATVAANASSGTAQVQQAAFGPTPFHSMWQPRLYPPFLQPAAFLEHK